MSTPAGYDLDEPQYDEADHRPTNAPTRRGVHWPTVAISTCAALVVGTAIPGLVLLGMRLGDEDRQVVVTMANPAGSSARTVDAGVSVPDPQSPAPAAAPAPVAAAAPAPAVPAATAPAAKVAAAPAADTATAPEGPSAPDVSTLKSQLQNGLAPATSDADIAASIEGGAAGVPTVRSVGNALNIASGIYRWDLTGPVTVTGDVARAQITTALAGGAPTPATLKWYWIDGQWKLSNDSICFMAHRAMTTCTVPGNPGGPNGHPL